MGAIHSGYEEVLVGSPDGIVSAPSSMSDVGSPSEEDSSSVVNAGVSDVTGDVMNDVARVRPEPS